jgi:hypothetical protein
MPLVEIWRERGKNQANMRRLCGLHAATYELEPLLLEALDDLGDESALDAVTGKP